MRKAKMSMMAAVFLVGLVAAPVWAQVLVEPTVVEIKVARPRIDDVGGDVTVRYLLVDVSTVDVQPVDETGAEGDGIPDFEPAAVLMLFPGGAGRLFLQLGQRDTASTNFLVRTRYHFAAEGFIVAVVDAASDFLAHNHATVTEPVTGFRHRSGLRGHRLPNRLHGDKYSEDLAAVINDLRARYPSLPLWAVGTSRGTISAAVAAAALADPPDGIVLTAALTGPSRFGDLRESNIDLGSVTVPTLIVTNQDDQCPQTKPEDSKRLKKRFTSSPRVQVVIFNGGSAPLVDACGALSGHGFFGIEQKVIDAVARWIKHVEQ